MKTLEENESNKSSMVGRIIYRPNLAEQEIFFRNITTILSARDHSVLQLPYDNPRTRAGSVCNSS